MTTLPDQVQQAELAFASMSREQRDKIHQRANEILGLHYRIASVAIDVPDSEAVTWAPSEEKGEGRTMTAALSGELVVLSLAVKLGKDAMGEHRSAFVERIAELMLGDFLVEQKEAIESHTLRHTPEDQKN
jgi:hypothetical protein